MLTEGRGRGRGGERGGTREPAQTHSHTFLLLNSEAQSVFPVFKTRERVIFRAERP